MSTAPDCFDAPIAAALTLTARCTCGLPVTAGMPCHELEEIAQFDWGTAVAQLCISRMCDEVREANGITIRRYRVREA